MRRERRWTSFALALTAAVFATGAGAQTSAENAARELVHPERGDDAMWLLLELGERAAAPLAAALRETLAARPPDLALAREQLRLLGLLGREARRVVPVLLDVLNAGPPVLHELTLWAVGETAPHAAQEARDAARAAMRASPMAKES